MATQRRQSFQQDISNAQQVDVNAPARVGAAIGQTIADTGQANAGLLSALGNTAIAANRGYQEVQLAETLNATTDTFFREQQAVTDARGGVQGAQFELNQAQRNLSEDAAGNMFFSDQAQATISDAEKKLQEKTGLLQQAVKSGQMSPDQALRRMAVDLRKSIAAWPGMADSFRKIASTVTGVDSLENYEVRTYYKQQEEALKAKQAKDKAALETAEKEAVKLYPITASRGMSLEQTTQAILNNDPSIMPYRTLYGIREEADATLKHVNANSNFILETKGAGIMSNYGVQAMGLISTQASNFLVQMQKEGNMAKYLNPNGTFNMNTFQELQTKNTSQLIQFQTTMSYALDESFRNSMSTLERVPGIGATAMQTARENLIKNHDSYKKMLGSADGVALVYNALLSGQKEGLQVAAQTLSATAAAANLLGTQQYMPQYLSNREAFASTGPGQVLVPIMDNLRSLATSVSNPLTEASKVAVGVGGSGVLPSNYASADEAKFVVSSVDLQSRDGLRKIAQKGPNQFATDADVKQYQETINQTTALIRKFAAVPGSPEFNKYVGQRVRDPAYQTVLKNMMPADRERFLAQINPAFDAAIEVRKADLAKATESFDIEWSPGGPKGLVKPVMVQDAAGNLTVEWNVTGTPPAATTAPRRLPDGRLAPGSATLPSQPPFTKDSRGKWVVNTSGLSASDLNRVQSVTKWASDINELARTKSIANASADGKVNSTTDTVVKPTDSTVGELKTEKQLPRAIAGGVADLESTVAGLRTNLSQIQPGTELYRRTEQDIIAATEELTRLKGK